MAILVNMGDIMKHVHTYEDVATYYAEFKDKCYEDKIAEGEMLPTKVPSPQELATEACMNLCVRKLHEQEQENKIFEKIRLLNERLDKIEQALDDIERN